MLMLTALAAASLAVTPVCSWDRPGRNRFTGDPVAAVDNYADIPPDIRKALQTKMATRAYDDMVVIGRFSIRGKHHYIGLRDMHFGANSMCRQVTREKWATDAQERALVYTVNGYSIIVPTVCTNVSRIDIRRSAEKVPGGSAVDDKEPLPPTAALIPDPPKVTDPGDRRYSLSLMYAIPTALRVPGGSGSSFEDTATTPPSITAAPPALPFIVPSAPPPAFGPYPVVPPQYSGPPNMIVPPGGDPSNPVPVDVVPATVVPELSTWMLILLGLGFIGIARRLTTSRM